MSLVPLLEYVLILLICVELRAPEYFAETYQAQIVVRVKNISIRNYVKKLRSLCCHLTKICINIFILNVIFTVDALGDTLLLVTVHIKQQTSPQNRLSSDQQGPDKKEDCRFSISCYTVVPFSQLLQILWSKIKYIRVDQFE